MKTSGRCVAFWDTGKRCANATGRCMATKTVLTTAAGDHHGDKQQHHEDYDDPNHHHPAWRAGGRFAVAPHAGALVSVGVGRPISHARLLALAFLHNSNSLSRQYVAVKSKCFKIVITYIGYTSVMPKLWNETIQAHRREVRDAILETTWALVAEHGLLSVTMSQIAEKTGIGRATLYKYFPDVEAILLAWHERHVTGHLEYLAEVRDQAGDAGERLEAVLEAYALISHEHHGIELGTELAALLHRGEHVARAQQQLRDMIRDLLSEAAETG